MKKEKAKWNLMFSRMGLSTMFVGFTLFTSCTVNFDDLTTGDISADGNEVDAEGEISDNEVSADGNTITDNAVTLDDLDASVEIDTDGDGEAEVEVTFETDDEDESDTVSSESEDESDTVSSEAEDESDTVSSESEDESDTVSSEAEDESDTVSSESEDESATTITFDFTFTDQTSAVLDEGTRIHISEVQGRGTPPVDLESGQTDASSQWNDVILTIADITDAWDAGYNIHIAAEYRDTVDSSRRIHFISLSETLEAAGLITDASDLSEAADYLNANAGSEIAISVSFPN